MKRLRIQLWPLLAGLALIVFVACGGDDDDASPGADAATPTQAGAAADSSPTADSESTATEEAAGSTEAAVGSTEGATEAVDATPTEEADATATEESQDEPTATTEASGDRLLGTASVEDDSEDVMNLLMNEPDDPMPGVDLRAVRLEGDGNQLVVTIETEGDIASALSSDVNVSFDVHIWQDDQPAYAFSLKHDGDEDWAASVTDFTSSILGDETSIETDISVDGNTISAAFPGSMLPELEATFQWYASVISSEGGMEIGLDSWFDGAPENVIQLIANPEEFVEFPQ